MVQTRAATRRQQVAHLTQNNQPTPLVASSTIVQINPSATGQGVHTRWIRPEGQDAKGHPTKNPNSFNDDNQVLVTPIRAPNGVPHSPPKLLRRPAGNANNQRLQWPGEQNDVQPQGRDFADHLQHLGDHLHNAHSSGNHSLASPFQDQQTDSQTIIANQLLRQESTYDPHRWNNTFQHIPQERAVTEPAEPSQDEVSLLLRKYRRGLGPHGTIIVDQNGNPIVPNLVNSQ